MTKVRDITAFMDELFPRETAESYDNPGLLAGAYDKEVTKCVITLDATLDKVQAAVDEGAELLITHHPLIFGGISDVSEENVCGQILSKLIRNDISLFAAHTNLDKNHGFSNDVLAGKVGGSNITHIDEIECGVICDIEGDLSVKSFGDKLIETLGTSGVITYSDPAKKVSKVFVQGGAFDEDMITYLKANGVDTVLSGEIKHHVMILLEQLGISALAAGHKATEDVFMSHLADVLTTKFPDVSFLVRL